MSDAAYEGALLDISYGREDAVGRDVDLFEAFYSERFKSKALDSFEKRLRRRWGLLAAASVVSACLFSLPLFVNANSLFAWLILIMGAMLLAVGVFYIVRLAKARHYCVTHFDDMLKGEFASARTVTKRVFRIRFFEERAEVDFGVTTGVRQKRVKRYSDIAAVYETDDLVFIEGLTWLSRFQVSEDAFRAMCALLQEKCQGRYQGEPTSPSPYE